jgi:hypothetical protein
VAISQRTIYTIGSSVIAVVLVSGAYVLSGPNALHFSWNRVDAASTQELLKEYSVKDSDNDGLPDWQEALYGTDPNNATSNGKGMTDGEAVQKGLLTPKTLSNALATSTTPTVPGKAPAAGSVTDEFAKTLYIEMMKVQGAQPLTADQISSVVQSSLAKLETQQKPLSTYSDSDVVVGGSGAASLTAYTVAVEKAFSTYGVTTEKSELLYLQDAAEKNDTAALRKVQAVGKAYTSIAKAVAKIPAPKEAAAAHLHLVNALARTGSAISDMGTFDTDPIRSLLGIGTYAPATADFVVALSELRAVYTTDGVTFTSGQPGYQIFKSSIDATTPGTP